jgi:apolipoprotein D and lipocalin family protein
MESLGLIFSLLLCLVASQADAQITKFFKKCPEIQTKENFDLSQYLGRWYEIEKYPNWFETGSCNGAEYKLTSTGSVSVNNSEVLDSGKLNFAIGEARQNPNSDIHSHLQVRFSKWQPWGQYLVLDTDYTSYTVVYSCTNLLIARMEFLWVMSRQRTLSDEAENLAYEKLSKYGISTSDLEKANQNPDTCKVLP